MNPAEALEEFFGPDNDVAWAHLTEPGPLRDTIQPWLDSVRAGLPTPVFLPRARGNRTIWYGLASTRNEAIELADITYAFVGGTYSDFNGQLVELDEDDAVERAVTKLEPGGAFRFTVQPVGDPETKVLVRDRLVRIRELLANRPAGEAHGSRPLYRVLSDFDLAVADQDEVAAQSLLDELQLAHHLSESNLAFLRVRLLHELGRHEELMSHPAIDAIAGVRRPRNVTLALLRSGHDVFLSGVRDADATGFIEAGKELVDCLGNITAATVTPDGIEAARALLAAALASDPDSARIESLLLWLEDVGYDIGPLRKSVGPVEPTDLVSLPDVFEALSEGDALRALRTLEKFPPEPEVARLAFHAASLLGDLESLRRAALIARPVREQLDRGTDERMLRLLAEQTGVSEPAEAPKGWLDWIERVRGNPEWPDARATAETGGTDWNADENTASEMARRLTTLDSASTQTFRSSIGLVVESHESVLDTPQGHDLLRTCLEIVALSDSPSTQELRALVGWVDVLASSGLPSDEYNGVLEAVRVLMGVGASPALTATLADLASVLAHHPPSDVDQRSALLMEISTWLRNLGSGVDVESRIVARRALLEAGLTVPEGDTFWYPEREEEGDPLDRLAGLKVGIYTLMDSVASRAKALLEEHVGPRGEVITDNSHDANPRLESLAAGCDVMVIVTAAAKHPATGAIEAARPDAKATIFVSQKGLSGLLRELRALLRNDVPSAVEHAPR